MPVQIRERRSDWGGQCRVTLLIGGSTVGFRSTVFANAVTIGNLLLATYTAPYAHSPGFVIRDTGTYKCTSANLRCMGVLYTAPKAQESTDFIP